MNNIQQTLEEIFSQNQKVNFGRQADYIPELLKANPKHFAIAIVTCAGEVYKVGNSEELFTLQSTSKPFMYGLALEQCGRDFVHSRVGVEPSGEAFNSIIELEKKTHRPYNPMINSGAIAISSFIKGSSFDQKLKIILEYFSLYTNRPLTIDESVFASEKKTAHRNRSIAHLLRHFDIIENDIEGALDLYFKQCSILVNVVDLAFMAATLANGGVRPITQTKILSPDYVCDLLSLMFTCGMYDSAGEWAYSVGLPAKSGVSGALFAVVPGKMGIAAYSPLINEQGHSHRGLRAIKELSVKMNLNMFKNKMGENL